MRALVIRQTDAPTAQHAFISYLSNGNSAHFLIRFWPGTFAVLLVGCSPVSGVSITRFESLEPQSCRASDVALDERQITSFFKRAERIDGRTLHDDYEWAPDVLTSEMDYQIVGSGTLI